MRRKAESPDHLRPRGQRRSGRFRVVLATLAIVTAVALPDVYPAVVDAATRQSDEDSRAQGYVVVTARAHVHACSDPLPTDISAADYAAFWNEPALNTPDAVALLEVLNEASAKDLRNSADDLRSRAETIRDPDKRANAHAAVDELAELLTHGRIQQAKRMVYEDLTALAQRTCLPDTIESFPPVSADSLASNWRAVTPENEVPLSWAAKDTGPVGGMVDKVYPAALAAALPRFAPSLPRRSAPIRKIQSCWRAFSGQPAASGKWHRLPPMPGVPFPRSATKPSGTVRP